MPIKRIHTEEFLKGTGGSLLLDVRSPAEYLHAHIPGAFNLPLFTDDERKIVGTAYKQQSREIAIKEGLNLFGPKMRTMVEEVENMIKNNRMNVKQELYVYCWRGGMRSAGVAWLLDLYGFKVNTLIGGYKAFRNYAVEVFRKPFNLNIIGGYTGSGKTSVLHQLKKDGMEVVDLEMLASHKGSAFGGIQMPKQPTQEMFENLLALNLQATADKLHDGGIWMEDESQRIGNCNIPPSLWHTMRNAPVYFFQIPFEERLDHITQEYGKCATEQLMEAVIRIKKRLGGLDTKNTLAYLEAGNNKEAFRILLHYYDKQYAKGLKNRENVEELLNVLACDKVTADNASVLSGKKLLL